ncbi:MAG: ATP-binding protein [Cellulomonadaceae bacterium]|nr:ATP-binding protein [Cellulomonadaceae bacterium]
MKKPKVRVVLLCGPSGCGKTELSRTLGLPVMRLDDFYHDDTYPDMPKAFGIIDWDDPRSWDSAEAMRALTEVAHRGRTEVPVYSIPTNSRTGTAVFDAHGKSLVIAEGVFAAQLVQACKDEGILADAIILKRHRYETFWFRLLRDLGERRKRPSTLIRRGFGLMRIEPKLIAQWTELGCHPLNPEDTVKTIKALAAEKP